MPAAATLNEFLTCMHALAPARMPECLAISWPVANWKISLEKSSAFMFLASNDTLLKNHHTHRANT